ncbi:MAG: transglutaminase family protein [Amphritea sp.]|jgi:transglutaminase-like putative cysteine protease|nr:transglutaminase family protein [uncultured Amphritea sp.]MDX2423176.1 transglutaminase family protein [Amphritea sp.]
MNYRIRHITHYEYEKPVTLCYNRAYLLPRNTDYQSCTASRIEIYPAHTLGQQRVDYFGNKAYFFSLEQPHKELKIDVVSDIKVHDSKYIHECELGLDLGNTCGQALVALQKSRELPVLEAREFVLNSPMIKAAASLREYARPSFASNRPLLSAVRELTHRIYTDFTYDPESTSIATPLDEVLRNKRGVCQDFAHLAIGCLRSLGFPARYISGYLETLPPPGQEKLVGSDASHAWFAVFSPGEGWFEFDPTNDNMPAEHHITTAWGRDYGDVSPLKGVFFDGGKGQKLSVSVDVSRLPTQE